ncbi:MAG: Mrp/NBP35 family ATP-binding protein [Clostridia bacterium]|nr:Mrp/NBP35 family ATP-binding protein [Clostridia bacterium]
MSEERKPQYRKDPPKPAQEQAANEIPVESLNELSSVKKIIGVVSGKGGVGKSLVTSLLAVEAANRGHNVAVLDADITGPSIPKAFGITEKATGDGVHIYPAITAKGVNIISINMLLENETDPVVWRGPVLAGVIKQFFTDVVWKDIDCMFVDMPPGTGDVPLTVFQSLPIDGIIVVTSPQDLVSMIVTKAVKMAKMMNVPVLGLVENMSYFDCPDCGKRHYIFGQSSLEDIAEQNGIRLTARLPIDTKFAELTDAGRIERADTSALADLATGLGI